MPALCQDAVSCVVTLPLRGPLAGQKGLKSLLPKTVHLDMPQRRPLVLPAFLFTIYVFIQLTELSFLSPPMA